LFNKAEANVYLNNINDVLTDLNAYASTRIYNYSAASHAITASRIKSFYRTSDIQAGALATVMDFKRAEFVQEGMRWFDLLRYDLPVTHTTTDGQTLVLEPGDKKRVLQIPASAQLSGVELNPR
jgi:hypothetical protein